MKRLLSIFTPLLLRAASVLLLYSTLLLLLQACGPSRKAEKKVTVSVRSIGEKPDTVAKAPKNYHPVQLEFSKKLGVAPDSLSNIRLYQFIKKWLGVRYDWGGETFEGIDCSAFVQRLFADVYDIHIPRTSFEQFKANSLELYSKTRFLSEGDLIFFKTIANDRPVTHVAFYLHNGYFVNSSSSKGVSIASIYDDYWKYKYVASGRLKKSYYENR